MSRQEPSTRCYFSLRPDFSPGVLEAPQGAVPLCRPACGSLGTFHTSGATKGKKLKGTKCLRTSPGGQRFMLTIKHVLKNDASFNSLSSP